MGVSAGVSVPLKKIQETKFLCIKRLCPILVLENGKTENILVCANLYHYYS